MLVLRGAPALSDFRSKKLLQQFTDAKLPITEIYAEFVHFAEITDALSNEQQEVLDKLLTYGPEADVHTPEGQLILVTPRPGTISPWSSKATDIAHNCGLDKLVRLERGCAYYLTGDTLDEADWQRASFCCMTA